MLWTISQKVFLGIKTSELEIGNWDWFWVDARCSWGIFVGLLQSYVSSVSRRATVVSDGRSDVSGCGRLDDSSGRGSNIAVEGSVSPRNRKTSGVEDARRPAEQVDSIVCGSYRQLPRRTDTVWALEPLILFGGEQWPSTH